MLTLRRAITTAAPLPGCSGNTVFYNLTGALAMLIGRFWLAVPTLALAGSLAAKKKVPAGAGTLSTTSLCSCWLIGVIVLVGALNFVPALALGPIIEHLLMIGAVSMNNPIQKQSSIRRELYQRAVLDSFLKLDPRVQVRNPVMFVVEVGSLLTTGLWIQALLGQGEAPAGFIGAVALWLWFTVFFANFSEALAEGRGKAQAEALRKTRQETSAKKLDSPPLKADTAQLNLH